MDMLDQVLRDPALRTVPAVQVHVTTRLLLDRAYVLEYNKDRAVCHLCVAPVGRHLPLTALECDYCGQPLCRNCVCSCLYTGNEPPRCKACCAMSIVDCL